MPHCASTSYEKFSFLCAGSVKEMFPYKITHANDSKTAFSITYNSVEFSVLFLADETWKMERKDTVCDF